MARPDVQIGERTFKPKEMGFGERIKAGVLYAGGMVVCEFLYTPSRVYERAIDALRLHIYYGAETVTAFKEALTPRVRSTTELQRIRQAQLFNHPNPHPQPVIDPQTREYGYRFVDVPSGTQTLVLKTY